MVDKKQARAQQPPMNVKRVVLALAGLVVAFVLINGGLNLLSHPDPQPTTTPRTTIARTSTTPGTTPGTSPGTTGGTTPGTTAGSTPGSIPGGPLGSTTSTGAATP